MRGSTFPETSDVQALHHLSSSDSSRFSIKWLIKEYALLALLNIFELKMVLYIILMILITILMNEYKNYITSPASPDVFEKANANWVSDVSGVNRLR